MARTEQDHQPGITEGDLVRIKEFLEAPPRDREPDLLQPRRDEPGESDGVRG